MATLEATRVAQLLPDHRWATKHLRPKGSSPHAKTAHPGVSLVEADLAVSFVTIFMKGSIVLLCVLGLGFFVNRNVGVGIFP